MTRRTMGFAFVMGIAVAMCGGSGCASGGATGASGSLKLDRVVLYQNGIGYFERRGKVRGPLLRMGVRRDQVNDLLKTLTVVDRGSGKTVSVSMPLEPDKWEQAAALGAGGDSARLARTLHGLRGTRVTLFTKKRTLPGRILFVEPLRPPMVFHGSERTQERGMNAVPAGRPTPVGDHRIALIQGGHVRVARLSRVRAVRIEERDVAMLMQRRLDASASQGLLERVEVTVRLGDRASEDLLVSYVSSAPRWKPSYRVVVEGQGERSLLQGWAVVDNTTSERWERVNLSLTSGEPLSFRYDLRTPQTVTRPDLTESSRRRRATVAVGEATMDDDGNLAEQEAMTSSGAEAPAASMPGGQGRGGSGVVAQMGESEFSRRPRNKRRRSSRNLPGQADKMASGHMDAGGLREAPLDRFANTMSVKTRAKDTAGLTQYELGERVTLPQHTSTMVPILNAKVNAEETFLFRPGGAGRGYELNPYRVVRFRNDTPFPLEPGPIAIYSQGSFVGEGLSERISSGGSATIPFAVENNIWVTSKRQSREGKLRLLRITRGVLEVERFSERKTEWFVERKGSQSKRITVYVRQNRASAQHELKDPPEGVERLPNAYLIPVTVPAAKKSAALEVVEQTPARTTITIWDSRATEILRELLEFKDLTPEIRKRLQPVVDLRLNIGRIDTELAELRQTEGIISSRLKQTRENLGAIKKDPGAVRLRRELNERLREFARESSQVSRRMVELQNERLKLKIRLEDQLQDLDFGLK